MTNEEMRIMLSKLVMVQSSLGRIRAELTRDGMVHKADQLTFANTELTGIIHDLGMTIDKKD